MKTRKQIMIEAHENAKMLEGDYLVRLAEGLRMAWACAKYDSKLSEKTPKDLFCELYYGNEFSIDAETILDIVKNKSKGFQADIANKALQYGKITEKQAWCIVFEFKNIA